MLVLTTQSMLIGFQDTESACSYRASAFLLDWLLFCQANKFIHLFIQHYWYREYRWL